MQCPRGNALSPVPNTFDRLPMTDRPSRLAQSQGRVYRRLLMAIGCSVLLLSSIATASELRETPIVKAVQRVRAAVVNIRGEKTVAAPPGQTSGGDSLRRVNGMGTGVVIDPRGYIVTNYHVVDGVREILVTMADGQKLVGRLAARDMETDLAIVKIETAKTLSVIPIGTSSDLMPGETVIAVGNAYGYEHTVTRGIVSALHRAVQVSDAQFYDDLIQTDASINPGNSGGPLLNIDGEMIGINVAVRAGAQGIGFAIPVDKVAAVCVGLLAACNTNKAWIGIQSLPTAPASRDGTVIGAVEAKSPAADAGLTSGDLIVAVNDHEIQCPLDFQRAILDCAAGETLRLMVRRSDNAVTVNLTVGKIPEETRMATQPAWDLLGLELKPIPTDEFRKNYQTRYRGGLMVIAVRPKSAAANQGIVPGDVLVGMHVWETASLENVGYILKRPDFLDINPLKFFILRGGETLYGYLPIASTKTAQR